MGAPGSQNSYLGVGLLSTVLDNGYDRFEGTSMSSPIVAGAAAAAIGILKSQSRAYSVEQIENVLKALSSVEYDLEEYFFQGRNLNVEDEITYLKNGGSLDDLPAYDPNEEVPNDPGTDANCF